MAGLRPSSPRATPLKRLDGTSGPSEWDPHPNCCRQVALAFSRRPKQEKIGALCQRLGDALRDRAVAERHPVEESQRTDDLVECRPRYPRRFQMNLERVNVL